MDIRKFYPSVDKDLLKVKLLRKLKCIDTLNLIYEIIDSNKEGLPLGNLLSQWMANYYLNEFDHFIKEQKKIKYYRYCDDMVMLHSNKTILHSLRRELQAYLRQRLHLDLSNYQVFPVRSRGINYVGYVIFETHVFIRNPTKDRYKRMVKYDPNTKSIASYKGWFVHANCKHLIKTYENTNNNEVHTVSTAHIL